MGNMEAEERKEEGTPSGETLEAAFGKLDQMLETLESSGLAVPTTLDELKEIHGKQVEDYQKYLEEYNK